ncbi:beta-hexosaminidase [bacterium]|nr:MAG: beta-hexosaminidase [bacterium]
MRGTTLLLVAPLGLFGCSPKSEIVVAHALAQPIRKQGFPPQTALVGARLVVGLAGTELDERTRSAIQQGKVGGLILMPNNIVSVEQLRRLTDGARAAAALEGRPPPMICIDQEGGRVDRLRRIPGMPPRASAARIAKRGVRHIEAAAFNVGRTLVEAGINVNFAPVADLRARGIVGDRSYGMDPKSVAACASAAVRGMQAAGIAAVVKHYPGHGMTTEDSHRTLPVARVKEKVFVRHEGVFQQTAASGPAGAMVGHLLVPSVDPALPASLSPTFVGKLRGILGPDGLIFTDSGSMDALRPYGNEARRAARALDAGVDVYLTTTPWAGLPKSFVVQVLRHVQHPERLEAAYERSSAWRAKWCADRIR